MLVSPLRKKINSIHLLSPNTKQKKVKNKLAQNKKLINEAKKKQKQKELKNEMKRLKNEIIKNTLKQIEIAKKLQKLSKL
jgi:esterase/lipase